MALSLAEFNRMVADHGPTMYRVAYRMVGDRHEAEDLVQEALQARVYGITYKPLGHRNGNRSGRRGKEGAL